MIRLRGLTWDHPRATRPLAAAEPIIRHHFPEVEIEWTAQPLGGFEHAPIADSAASYDLIIFDHPHVGEIAAGQLFLPLDELAASAGLGPAQFVGPSYDSYLYEGRRWGLPIDAAAQVACLRPQPMAALDVDVPRCWDQVFDLAERARRRGWYVAGSLNGVHALMSFLTLCGNLGKPIDTGRGLDAAIGADAVALLRHFAAIAHPGSLKWNSIVLQDSMRDRDDVIYCPLVYGFVPYTSATERTLHYHDIPGPREQPAGSIIGGAGIGVSNESVHPKVAADIAILLVSECVQRDVIASAGGQPAHVGAWEDPSVNATSAGFYNCTRATLERSTVRPRFAGYMDFQREASMIVELALRERATPGALVVSKLNDCFARAKESGLP